MISQHYQAEGIGMLNTTHAYRLTPFNKKITIQYLSDEFNFFSSTKKGAYNEKKTDHGLPVDVSGQLST